MLRKKTYILKRSVKGQNIVEYILLITAVIVVALAFLGPNGMFQKQMNATLDAGTNGMVDMANRLANSRPLSP